MNYLKKITIFILILTLGTITTKAISCPSDITKELYQDATHIKFIYNINDKSEIKELVVGSDKTTYTVPNFEFEIELYNLTENLYADIKENVFNTTTRVNYSDTKDNIYTIINKDFGRMYNYEVTIYSNKSECYGQKIKTIKLIKPMYNAYSEYTYCQNSNNYYCQRFTTRDLKIKDTEDFLKKILGNNTETEEIEETVKDTSILGLIKKHWVLYLSSFVVIIILTTSIIIIIRRRWRL